MELVSKQGMEEEENILEWTEKIARIILSVDTRKQKGNLVKKKVETKHGSLGTT